MFAVVELLQLDKHVVEAIAVGDQAYMNKSLIKVSGKLTPLQRNWLLTLCNIICITLYLR